MRYINIKGELIMRWILVFVFLYLVPLVILFKNHKNKKRSFIYGSMYIVAMSTIVISNIYMSGLNRIEESMNKRWAVEVHSKYDLKTKDEYSDLDLQEYNSEYESTKNDESEDIDGFNDELNDELDDELIEESSKFVTDKDDEKLKNSKKITTGEKSVNDEKPVNSENYTENEKTNKSDKETYKNKIDELDLKKIDAFRQDVFDVEKSALKPMQKCIPYTKNVMSSLKNLKDVKKDVKVARNKCDELASYYEDMNIPNLSDESREKKLVEAKGEMQKTYELRTKSMENALKLIDSKNPKYINSITDYLDISDESVKNFTVKINKLVKEIESESNNI